MKKRWLAICITLLIMNVVVASCGGSESEQVRKVQDVGVVSTEYYGDFNDFSLMEQLGMDANSSELAVIEESSLTDAAQSLIEKGCKILIFCVDLDEYTEEIEQFKSGNPDIEVYEVDIDEAKDYYYNSYGEGSDNGTDSEGSGAKIVSRGTWLSIDPNGYKVEGEVLTSDSIRASDWDTVQSTYDGMGYSESLPGFDVIAPDGANQDTSVVIVGEIKLKNITEGWDFSESSPYDCALCIRADDLYGYNFSSIYIFSKRNDLGGVRGVIDTNVVMDSNEGNIPFAIVIPDVFTPNDPDGKESVFNAELAFFGSSGTSQGATSCAFTVPSLHE